ncbi:hypothetical protein GCM10017788_35840 [Amycolatopsis acidiphila]|nr:hypothetical protein GCM10017788_35840 [Amycolatopsis acidiphila]
MKPLPLPLRIAAGLAVTAAERARELPKNLVGLPVTVVSQVLQFSMRLQQQVTELAIKGDEVLSALHPVEDTPSWATFDEDLPPVDEAPTGNNGHRSTAVLRDVSDNARDPWEQEERALAEDHTEGEFDSESGPEGGPTGGNGGGNGAGSTTRRNGRPDLRSVGGTDSGDDAEAVPGSYGDIEAAAAGSGGDVEAGGAESGGNVAVGGTESGGDVEAGGAESGRAVETGGDTAPGASVGDATNTSNDAPPTLDDATATTESPTPTSGNATPTIGAAAPTFGGVPSLGGAEADDLGASGPDAIGIEPEGIIGSAGLANYDELTLPQLRARLRRFTLEQLEELLAYERTHENRPSFVGMLTRRIGNVQRLSEGDSGTGTPGR